MDNPEISAEPYYNIIDKKENNTNITHVQFCSGITVKNAHLILKSLASETSLSSVENLTVDLKDVPFFDDYGALVLFELKKMTRARNGSFNIINAKSQVKHILSITDFEEFADPLPKTRKKTTDIITHYGELTLNNLFNIRYMIAFLGSVITSFFYICLHPKSLRIGDTITCMEKTGVQALPIVAMISFLLGLVMAFMSSLQLQQFGANIYVASFVSIAMVSELGPIMTAIVVAGRSGSAFAAEIGTMKISEEIDALFIMGFQPTQFLVIPRLIASMIVVPILTLFADLFAIAGGLLIGVLLLDLTMTSFITEALSILTLFEVLWGLSKSFIFSMLIAWVSCMRGFQTRGGADAVGNAATSAVVSSIFLIILFDSIFAVTRSYIR